MRVETPAEQLLYSTVLVETESGDPPQKGVGTSFIFSIQRGGNTFLSLVTNKHVVKEAARGRFFFTKRQAEEPLVGQRYDVHVEQFENAWFGHPDPAVDVAVLPLLPIINHAAQSGVELYFRAIPHTAIPSDQQLEELDALEEVVFVGYPSGIYDTVNLLPVLRRGTTATPAQVDYDGRPLFLVDGSVFPGSSGSPVLVYNLGAWGSRRGLIGGTRLLLLGLMAQVAYQEEEGELEFHAIPSIGVPFVRTRQMLDLGVVFKARTILETAEALLQARGEMQEEQVNDSRT